MNDSELLDFLLSDAGVDGVNASTRSPHTDWRTGYGTSTYTITDTEIINGDDGSKDKAIAGIHLKGEDTTNLKARTRPRKRVTRGKKKTVSTQSHDSNHGNDTSMDTITENLDNLTLSGSNSHTETTATARENTKIKELSSISQKINGDESGSQGSNQVCSQELDSAVPSIVIDRDNGTSIRKKRGKRAKRKKEKENGENKDNDHGHSHHQRYNSSSENKDDNTNTVGTKGLHANEQHSHSNGVTRKNKPGTRRDSKTTTKNRRDGRGSYDSKIEKVKDFFSARDIRNKLKAEGLGGSDDFPTQGDITRNGNSGHHTRTHRKSKYDYYMRDTDPNLMIVEY